MYICTCIGSQSSLAKDIKRIMRKVYIYAVWIGKSEFSLWQVVPVNGLFAMLPEVGIGLGEMLVAKETTVSREGGGMGRLQHTVSLLQ